MARKKKQRKATQLIRITIITNQIAICIEYYRSNAKRKQIVSNSK